MRVLCFQWLVQFRKDLNHLFSNGIRMVTWSSRVTDMRCKHLASLQLSILTKLPDWILEITHAWWKIQLAVIRRMFCSLWKVCISHQFLWHKFRWIAMYFKNFLLCRFEWLNNCWYNVWRHWFHSIVFVSLASYPCLCRP